jgi:hypothetical protein
MSSIQGQLLRLNERREVAIYLRQDSIWIADFIDGCGELIDKPDARKMSFALNFDPGAFRNCSTYFVTAGAS